MAADAYGRSVRQLAGKLLPEAKTQAFAVLKLLSLHIVVCWQYCKACQLQSNLAAYQPLVMLQSDSGLSPRSMKGFVSGGKAVGKGASKHRCVLSYCSSLCFVNMINNMPLHRLCECPLHPLPTR